MNDGGPAYPHELLDTRSQYGRGMSLRDYFAGQALAEVADRFNTWDLKYIAEEAYELADAMLKEREKE